MQTQLEHVGARPVVSRTRSSQCFLLGELTHVFDVLVCHSVILLGFAEFWRLRPSVAPPLDGGFLRPWKPSC